MVRNSGEFVACLEQATHQFGMGPGCCIVARKSEFGAEHAIGHVKVRQGRTGLELVVQIAERPNES